MKRIIAVMLIIVFALSFAACGKNDNNAKKDTAATTAAPATTEAASESETEAAPVAELMTFAQFDAANIGDAVTVETYVQAKQIYWEGAASLYAQSEDGAYFIYQMPCTEDEYAALTAGVGIRVSGTKSEWKGEIEITDAKFEFIDGTFIAEPTDVTALLGTDELKAHKNQLVSFKGLTVEAKTDADGNEAAFFFAWDGTGSEGADLYFDVSLNGEKYTFTVESDLCGAETDVYKAVKALSVGDVIDLEGFLYWYEGVNPHIISVTPAQ